MWTRAPSEAACRVWQLATSSLQGSDASTPLSELFGRVCACLDRFCNLYLRVLRSLVSGQLVYDVCTTIHVFLLYSPVGISKSILGFANYCI